MTQVCGTEDWIYLILSYVIIIVNIHLTIDYKEKIMRGLWGLLATMNLAGVVTISYEISSCITQRENFQYSMIFIMISVGLYQSTALYKISAFRSLLALPDWVYIVDFLAIWVAAFGMIFTVHPDTPTNFYIFGILSFLLAIINESIAGYFILRVVRDAKLEASKQSKGDEYANQILMKSRRAIYCYILFSLIIIGSLTVALATVQLNARFFTTIRLIIFCSLIAFIFSLQAHIQAIETIKLKSTHLNSSIL